MSTLRAFLHRINCRLGDHELFFVQIDPRPREYAPSGKPILRRAMMQCRWCGRVSE